MLLLLLAATPSASASLEEVPLPTEAEGPIALKADAQGRLWMTLHETWAVARYDPRTNETRVIPLPTEPRQHDVYALVSLDLDPQGVVWALGPRHLYRVDPDTLAAEAIALPFESRLPGEVMADARGAVWVSLVAEEALFRFDPESSAFARIAVPGERMGPLGFAEDAGQLWVSLTYAGTLGTLEAGGDAVRPLPRDLFRAPYGILAWRGGIWVGEHGGNAVARYDIDTGRIDWYPGTRAPISPIIGPSDLIDGDDGALWFTEHLGERVARLDIENNTLVEWDLVSEPYTNTVHLTQAPDGTVWAGVEANDTLARVRYEGQQPAFEVPARLAVERNSEIRVPIDGSGEFLIGTSHDDIQARVEGREVVVKVWDPPAGGHRLVVSQRDGAAVVGRYVLLEVEPHEEGSLVPGPGPFGILAGVLAAAALLRYERSRRRSE